MKLGLWYVPGTDEEVDEACNLAAKRLADAGVSIADGYAALLRAVEGESLATDAEKIIAWYEAEAAALLYLHGVTNVWPDQGALILVPA